MSATCIECGRTFDLLTETAHGHDCEPNPYTIYDLPYYSTPAHLTADTGTTTAGVV